MDILSQLCQEIIDANDELEDMDVEKYLDDMKRLEKGGVSFMDINKIDVKKAKRGPKIAASVFIIIMIAFIALMVLGKITDPETPMFFIILMIGLCAAAIIGVSLALSQRLKEIDGGEQNEANKY